MEYGLGRQNNHVRTTTTAKPGNDRIKRYSKVLKGKATTTSRGQAQVAGVSRPVVPEYRECAAGANLPDYPVVAAGRIKEERRRAPG
jgi:hypothetical protein